MLNSLLLEYKLYNERGIVSAMVDEYTNIFK